MRSSSTSSSVYYAVCTASIVLYSLLTLAYQKNFELPIVERSSSTSKLVDVNWYPPSTSWITNLTAVINGTGTFGMRFDNGPPSERGQYSYCNMEHVNSDNYVPATNDNDLVYVEVIHRHHKRTPYMSNGLSQEVVPWNCSDYSPISTNNAVWSIYSSSSNPFQSSSLRGTCLFPQLTRGGAEDARKHGQDFLNVYKDFIASAQISIRVTNNYITTQVATSIIEGLLPKERLPVPLLVQPSNFDSLEPVIPCPKADALRQSIISSRNSGWSDHLTASSSVFEELDGTTEMPPSDSHFHNSFDPYFDNLSSNQCHGRLLPCSPTNSTRCISQEIADTVYRLGQWEYSFIYRGSKESFDASVAQYGPWLSELVQNIRHATKQNEPPKLRYNIAHDGSISRLLSILQIDRMVWPGMGAEVVFEVYRSKSEPASLKLRVLWSGSPLQSSNPSLGLIDMIDLDTFLSYVDQLVGVDGSKLLDLCRE